MCFMKKAEQQGDSLKGTWSTRFCPQTMARMVRKEWYLAGFHLVCVSFPQAPLPGWLGQTL